MTRGLVQCHKIDVSPGDDVSALLQHVGAYAPTEPCHVVAVFCQKGALHACILLLYHSGLGSPLVVRWAVTCVSKG